MRPLDPTNHNVKNKLAIIMPKENFAYLVRQRLQLTLTQLKVERQTITKKRGIGEEISVGDGGNAGEDNKEVFKPKVWGRYWWRWQQHHRHSNVKIPPTETAATTLKCQDTANGD